MCLYVKHTDSQIAEHDIVSYKVALAHKGTYRAPYQGTYYTLDEKLSSDLTFTPYKDWEGYEYQDDKGHLIVGEVDEGYHSVNSLAEARKVLRELVHRRAQWDGKQQYTILKCTIPKGATYYTGRWNKTDGFASSEIIIHKNALTFMEKVGNFAITKWTVTKSYVKEFFHCIFG